MEKTYRIGKKYVKGDRKGKRFTETINIKSGKTIHSFLWDLTNSFDMNRCTYIVEWYREISN